MPKSLRLLWAQAEDLPTPLAARLHLSGSNRMRVLAFHKPCEVPCDVPFTLKFYSSGELIGVIRVVTSAVDSLERRWIPLEMGEIEVSWGEFEGGECLGPRVQLTLEPMRPLSPILELTEANECSATDCTPSSRPTSPEGDQLREVIESLQREREMNSETLKNLQLKVMELQQALVKERWENRISVEQLEVKHKGETSQLMLALDKARGLQKKETALTEALTEKLTETEEKLAELKAKTDPETVVLKATIDQLEENLGKKTLEVAQIAGKLPILEHRNSTLDLQLKTTESRLATASAQLSTLRTEHEALLSSSQLLSNELNSAKSLKQTLEVSQTEGKKSFAVSFLEAEKATMAQQLQEMQRTVGKLKNDLAEAVTENEKKERDLRNSATLVDSLKAKLQAYETTIKVLKASAGSLEAPDPVDEALKDYLKGKKGLAPFVKLAEGVYSYGQQQVHIAVKQGEIVVRTRRESVAIEEFLATAEGKERSHSRHRSTSRPRSVDMDREWQHYRTMSNFIDLAKQGEALFDQSSTQRVHTDTCEYGTERLSRPLLAHRDTTPSREYLKQTISSTLKATGKSQTPRPKAKSRIMKM